MSQQHSLREPISFTGTGLHSGNRVQLRILPAAPQSGIRFRRVDLEGRPEIEARVENVQDTTRSTTLARGNIRIHTVEHLLAACAGSGLDNAVIELDANEPPIGDGSAREFCRLIRQAGLEPQGVAREAFVVTEPIQFQNGQSIVSVFPHEGMKISCTSADRAGRFTQFFSIEVTPENWEKELASARTFCFFEEIEFLIKNGLIKGGSLENAVVIRDDAVLTTEPLRYPEEFVRHKILDIIGDLALLGRPVSGHIVAIRPSHTSNCELARLISAQIRKTAPAAPTFVAPPAEKKSMETIQGTVPIAVPGDGALDVIGIMKLLPHRHPFLMVDKVLSMTDTRITALKNVSVNEPFFEGHFPGHPVMPGVLQLEAIAQVAGILMFKQIENAGKIAYFMSADRVRWRKPVRPGDQLIIDVELTKARGRIGKARGTCVVAGEVVSEGDVTFMLVDA